MDDKIRSELRIYAWNYFSLHATQRLTTFNFYLVISTLLTAGLWSTVTQAHDENLWIAIVICLLITVISIIFEKLDERNRIFVHSAEQALRYLDDHMGLEDDGNIPHVLKLVARDDYETKLDEMKKARKSFWPSELRLRYSHCFGYVFLSFKSVGIGTAIIIAFLIISKSLTTH